MDQVTEDIKLSKLRPKAGLHLDEALDVKRLKEVYPQYNVKPQSDKANTVWESDVRQRQFRWWLGNETREREGHSSVLEDRSKLKGTSKVGEHPLMITDTFLPMATVEERIYQDDRAKAEYTNTLPPPTGVSGDALRRLGGIILIGGGIILLGYMIANWKK